jgi:hypothetical protein
MKFPPNDEMDDWSDQVKEAAAKIAMSLPDDQALALSSLTFALAGSLAISDTRIEWFVPIFVALVERLKKDIDHG